MGEHGHGAALAADESVRQALHQGVFEDLSLSAELLGSAHVLEDLRARGRALQEDPEGQVDNAELARAVEDLLTSIYDGVPLIISRMGVPVLLGRAAGEDAA